MIIPFLSAEGLREERTIFLFPMENNEPIAGLPIPAGAISNGWLVSNPCREAIAASKA